MIGPNSFRHKELRHLFLGQRARIDDRWRRKLERMLASLNVAVSPAELTIYRCHPLTGDRTGHWAMHVSPNFRLTFSWSDEGPAEIDLEDYHGA